MTQRLYEKYLVGTVFLVDHPSQHPTAGLVELGRVTGAGLGRDSQPKAVFQQRGGRDRSLEPQP